MANEKDNGNAEVKEPVAEASIAVSADGTAAVAENKFSKFFKLRANKTTIKKELIAGLTTFVTMAYIIFVNPNILGKAGMPMAAVFLATIIASVIGTLIMGLFANVPYAQAPGMGLNAFFTYTVCLGLGFTWQAALAMVFICGLINIAITVTGARKHLLKAIPRSLQSAIGAGIGIFIAYIGLLNANLINFDAEVPALSGFIKPDMIVALFGLVVMIVLMVKKIKGAILMGIGAATVLAVIFAASGFNTNGFDADGNALLLIDWGSVKFTGDTFAKPFVEMGDTFGAAFYDGFPSLFSNAAMLPIALVAIFAFSLTDTFDTVGTFIGTGRRSGIFTEDDEKALETSRGFKTKMDRALLADAVATSIGAVFGTSNTTTYVESSAGIEAGGRTGLTSVMTAALFFVCIFISPLLGVVTSAATAPALIVVGVLMVASIKDDINWADFAESVPAFFTVVLMALAYNISVGMAFGFILHILIKSITGKAKEIHPILWVSSALFIVYFVFMGLIEAGVFASATP